LGSLPYQTLVSKSISDRASIKVNVANGNLLLESNDFNIGGHGPSLSVNRYFNDMGTGSGQVGSHNTIGLGADIHITVNANGSATYQGPSGFSVIFPSNGSGGYTTPASYSDGALSTVAGGGWNLTLHKSGEVFTFDSTGNQIKDSDSNGLYITYVYNINGTLSSATDIQGKTLTFSNYSGLNVGKITDSSGRFVTYSYSNGQLTGVTDTDGKTWQYQYYDTRGNINQIVDPR
jgi:YD repeat-containing protein